MAKRIDGKGLAEKLREALSTRMGAFQQAHGRPAGLGVLLAGDNPASEVYVRNKLRIGERVGAHTSLVRLPGDCTTEDVISAIQGLNVDPAIDAFLVQLPLPEQVDAERALAEVSPDKDVDGLHEVNLGRLAAGLEGPRPCTPSGCMAMLRDLDVELSGKRAVVVGRSTIVGKPMALMLLEANATVTICHSRTENLAEVCAQADILVAAVGRPNFIGPEHVKPGAIVLDVGINRVDGKLVGDVDYEAVQHKAAAVTPVPGGVGPMTVHYVLENTLYCAERALRT